MVLVGQTGLCSPAFKQDLASFERAHFSTLTGLFCDDLVFQLLGRVSIVPSFFGFWLPRVAWIHMDTLLVPCALFGWARRQLLTIRRRFVYKVIHDVATTCKRQECSKQARRMFKDCLVHWLVCGCMLMLVSTATTSYKCMAGYLLKDLGSIMQQSA